MASVINVKGKWRASIRRAGQKPITKTFEKKSDADMWARRIEAEFDRSPNTPIARDGMTIAQIIKAYERMREEMARPIQPTTNTRYMLDHLREDLGDDRITELLPERLIKWARLRKEQGCGPYTVNMELSQLGTVLKHTAGYLNIVLPDVIGAARPMLHYAQLIGGGNRRTRCPEDDELDALLEWIVNNRTDGQIVADAIDVGAWTGLRRGELARIAWADIDVKKKAVLVRARKHPRAIEAKNEWVPLLGKSWDIVNRQPRTDERIFPLTLEQLTKAVTYGTRELGIPDLHLHDIRRYATSKLRELGFDKDERKKITGHRSDEIHERYISITLESLHAKHDAAQDKQPRQPRQRKARDRQL